MKIQALKDALNRDISVLYGKGDLAEAERIRAALKYVDAHDDLIAEVVSLKESGKKIIASEMERTAEVIRLRDINDDLVKALQVLTAWAEGAEVMLEGEFGKCRNLAKIEAAGDLPDEIVQARAALAKAGAA